MGKQTWEMAIITRTGKFRTNEQREVEPEEKTDRYSGTMIAGRAVIERSRDRAEDRLRV
jgi:hypothetical protein